jgi:roadblock/LC7 domain-containing protein
MEMMDELQMQIDRVAGVAEQLEKLISRQSAMAADGETSLGRIVAMVEATAESRREAELVERLAEAERTIAELRASAVAASGSARRTLPVSLLAKQEGSGEFAAGSSLAAVDAALVSLSPEQRIAVKSQLMRAGLV